MRGSRARSARRAASHVFDAREEGYLMGADDDSEEEPMRAPAAERSDPDPSDDPLDQLMADYEAAAKEALSSLSSSESAPKALRLDDLNDKEEYDADQAHLVSEAKQDEAKEVEYDEDGNPVIKKRGGVPILPPLNPSEMNFAPFEKNFYSQHTEVSLVPASKIAEWLQSERITVAMPYHAEPLRPVWEFRQFNLDPHLTIAISQAGFQAPTPIQSVAMPVALSGYDLIATAKTGSGKTLAFVWPMIQHILGQESLAKGEGPIGVVLSPTRELADQTMKETMRFAKVFDLDAKSIMGGLGKWEQKKALHNQPDIIIATPGRLIDMLKLKATNMRRCTVLVLDEADRMFDLGFEPQIRSIIGQIRPERQTLLFSATFHRRVEALAREVLINPVRITIGNSGQSNTDVQQIIKILRKGDEKWRWLTENIYRFSNEGKVLIFVGTKENASEMSARINKECHLLSDAIHGDKHQSDRTAIMNRFKKDHIHILVATDLAARGLDVEGINTVINYDRAKNIETHIHRVGRTGRMGRQGVTPGTAYTLLTPSDAGFAGELVYNLQRSQQSVSSELLELASKNPRFHPPRGLQTAGAPEQQYVYKSGFSPAVSLGGRSDRLREAAVREEAVRVPEAALQSAQDLHFMNPSPAVPAGYQSYQIPSLERRPQAIGQNLSYEAPTAESASVGGFVRSRAVGEGASSEPSFSISAPRVEAPVGVKPALTPAVPPATAPRPAASSSSRDRRRARSPSSSSSSSRSRSRSRSRHRHGHHGHHRHH